MPANDHDQLTEMESERGYIRALLTLTTSQDGGRTTPITSGYRSSWAFNPKLHSEWHDGPLTLEDAPERWLQPGESAVIRIHPLVPELWPNVERGWQLKMQEGGRVVGAAEVIEVVPPSA